MIQLTHPELEEGRVPTGFRRPTASMLPGRQYRRRRVRYHAHSVQHPRVRCTSLRLTYMHSGSSLDGPERPERAAALHQDSRHHRDPLGR